jgi:hypothetical protein
MVSCREHNPEKWMPLFGKRSCSPNKLERDDDAKKGHHAISRALPWVVGAVALLTAAPGHAQSNLDAGKSPAQIFSDTCNACHRTPRELRPSSVGFLREHYTTGAREAAVMAAYLSSVGSDARAVQQRKPPTLGAGQAPAESATAPKPPQPVPGGAVDPGKPAETQAALPATGSPRHNGSAAEQGREQAKPAAAIVPFKPRRPSDSIEAGRLPATGSAEAEVPAQSAAMPAAKPGLLEEFEE